MNALKGCCVQGEKQMLKLWN